MPLVRTENARIILVAAQILGGLVTTPPALAQEMTRAEMRAIASVCRADVRRLCGNVEPGEGRIKACMSQNRDNLSEGCRNALLTAAAK